jgi:hypothetical protein
MYPQRQLTLLAARKIVLQRSIAQRRSQCVVDAIQLTRPLAWLDRAQTFWTQIPPLAKVAALSLGLLVLKRALFPQRKVSILGPLLRWGTIILDAKAKARKADNIPAGSAW